jgi:ribosomal protein L11 methyltransferase
MPWIQAHLIIPKQQTSIAELVMETIGAVSITLGDAQDEPVLETLPDEIRLWTLVRLTALFEFSPDISDHIRHQVNQAFNKDISQQLDIEILEDQEWERAWLDHFKPIKFGNKLWICPTGNQVNEENAIVIDLDPGLAFGTGTHPTTALCLEWLDSQATLQNKSIIDYGCGSGILAIAALKLGAHNATGIDYDPQALTASRDNAEKNHVSDHLSLMKSAPQNLKKTDILIANILAGVLIELSGDIAALVKPQGQIVLSGILPDQANDVLAEYRQFFTMQPVVQKQGWIRLEGQRDEGRDE